jgi:hypothetical protein
VDLASWPCHRHDSVEVPIADFIFKFHVVFSMACNLYIPPYTGTSPFVCKQYH